MNKPTKEEIEFIQRMLRLYKTIRKYAFLEAAEMVLNERCVQPEYVTSEIWYAQDLTKLLKEKAEDL